MNNSDKESVQFVQKAFKKWNLELEITSNQYSQEDLTFKWNNNQYSVEVKKRRFKKDTYPTTIIEKSKWDYLLSHNGILVVLFDDCWVIFKNLKSAYKGISIKPARQTTDFKNQKWVNKEFVELDLKKCLEYKFQI